jgi:phosphoribosylformylglycinamidine synthase PurS subunit
LARTYTTIRSAYGVVIWRLAEMPTFVVEIVIENKKMARDPEGETIAKELISREGFAAIKSVRTGKYLRLLVEAADKEEAEQLVTRMSNTLRIFNPVVHTCNIRAKSDIE